MTRNRVLFISLAVGLVFSAAAARAAGDAANGEKVFAKCKACHTVEAGKNKIGPSLHGVIGRKAGSLEGYKYSDAMKESGITWDAASLHAYLAAPKKEVPGGKMMFVGLPDEQDRQDVIAYLKEASK